MPPENICAQGLILLDSLQTTVGHKTQVARSLAPCDQSDPTRDSPRVFQAALYVSDPQG